MKTEEWLILGGILASIFFLGKERIGSAIVGTTMGPNVEMIRSKGMRIVRGRIPREVRQELMLAVKNKQLGHFKRDGLLPEMFFHPDQLHTAREIQKKEAEYSISLLKKIMM